MTGLIVLIILAIVEGLMLTCAIVGDAHLAEQNRRLRAENAQLRKRSAARPALVMFTGGDPTGGAA